MSLAAAEQLICVKLVNGSNYPDAGDTGDHVLPMEGETVGWRDVLFAAQPNRLCRLSDKKKKSTTRLGRTS